MFIVECVERNFSISPGKVAYRFVDGDDKAHEITYEQLRLKSRAIANAISEKVEPGGAALLLYAPGLEFIVAFIACLYAGITPVPNYPPIARRLNADIFRLELIAEDLKPEIILCDSATEKLLSSALFKENLKAILEKIVLLGFSSGNDLTLDEIPVLTTDAKNSQEIDKPLLNPHDIAYFQYSSGSTQHPKAIMVSSDSVKDNTQRILRSFDLKPEDSSVSWLPHYHDMGLIGFILTPLVGEYTSTLLSPLDFVEKPIRWLNAVSKYKPKLTGGPNFSFELCIKESMKNSKLDLDLSSLQLALCGAEPIDPELPHRFYEHFKDYGLKKSAFFPVYGLAEHTLLVSCGPIGREPVIKTFNEDKLRQFEVEEAQEGVRLVGCGQIQNDELLIVNPDNHEEQGPSRTGEIWLKSPSVTSGYWNKPEKTKQFYKAFTTSGKGPYLRTEDMGFIHEGELFLYGRLRDLIELQNKKYAPQDIELAVQNAHDGIRKGNIAAFAVTIKNKNHLVIVAEKNDKVKAEHSDLYIAIVEAIALKFHLNIYEIVLVQPRSIHKTTSGKIQRQYAKKSYLTKKLRIVDSWLSPWTKRNSGIMQPL